MRYLARSSTSTTTLLAFRPTSNITKLGKSLTLEVLTISEFLHFAFPKDLKMNDSGNKWVTLRVQIDFTLP